MGIWDTLAKTAVKKAIVKSAEEVAIQAIVTMGEASANKSKKPKAITKNVTQVRVVVSEKNALPSIRVPRSADEFVGTNVDTAKEEFELYGFTNIIISPQKDLRKNIFNKKHVGEIVKIAINGVDDFKKRAKFFPDARIVIIYHTFRD